MINFNLNQLSAFTLAADLGSFSAAARKLGKAHSAVSTAIANLELDLNVELFERSGRNPILSPAGEALYAEAEQILLRCEQLQNLANQHNPQLESSFTLVIDDLIGLPMEQQFLNSVGELFPNLQLTISEALSQDVIARIAKDEADIGIAIVQQQLAGSLHTLPLWPQEMSYFCSPSHPLAKLEVVNTQHLQQHRQVLLARSELFESLKISPYVWKVDTLAAASTVAEAQQAWLVAPEHYLQERVSQGKLIKLTVNDELNTPLQIVLVWRANKSQGLVHQAIINWFKKALAE
ncbi:LysR family transcriptional regulator [Agarivorans aestuarii]|uniref:LysR family transcriptional regulator n=1 Tax=Agarivorans aestuarii TaxID=1563703 RepID=A0ABU7G496_9ALTE|nr:LysR family transcriptional regulator [Agarivorans aestuarii]MEE1674131.1 LysR family transcriptional regulator [Agarivorans aestuarii]